MGGNSAALTTKKTILWNVTGCSLINNDFSEEHIGSIFSEPRNVGKALTDTRRLTPGSISTVNVFRISSLRLWLECLRGLFTPWSCRLGVPPKTHPRTLYLSSSPTVCSEIRTEHFRNRGQRPCRLRQLGRWNTAHARPRFLHGINVL